MVPHWLEDRIKPGPKRVTGQVMVGVGLAGRLVTSLSERRRTNLKGVLSGENPDRLTGHADVGAVHRSGGMAIVR